MSNSWYNNSGKPLSSLDWLKEHHFAKLDERSSFINKHFNCTSKIITDLGCGPGLWLGLMNDLLPKSNKLIGIDMDVNSIEYIKKETRKWFREVELIPMAIEDNIDLIPFSDYFLLFNIFPYLNNPLLFLGKLRKRLNKGGKIIVRQYDGSLLRFGPIENITRMRIENSLYASIGASNQFKHYNLDSVYEAIELTQFENKEIYFEIYQKMYPYDAKVLKYITNSLKWTHNYIDELSSKKLKEWENNKFPKKTYFLEVDLVAILS